VAATPFLALFATQGGYFVAAPFLFTILATSGRGFVAVPFTFTLSAMFGDLKVAERNLING